MTEGGITVLPDADGFGLDSGFPACAGDDMVGDAFFP